MRVTATTDCLRSFSLSNIVHSYLPTCFLLITNLSSWHLCARMSINIRSELLYYVTCNSVMTARRVNKLIIIINSKSSYNYYSK